MIPEIQQISPTDTDAAAIGQYPYPDDSLPMEQPEPVDVLGRLNAQFAMTNIADGLEKERLAQIGRKVVDDFETDKNSRADWDREQEQIKDIAQIIYNIIMWHYYF
jgi:hypothetical protein